MNEIGREERITKIGSAVRLRLASGVRVYVIVANGGSPNDGTVSMHSPLGQAVLGKKVHARVTVRTPAGEQQCEILEIL